MTLVCMLLAAVRRPRLQKHPACDTAGVKFLEHLQGVQRVLESWGEPDAVSLAGLFHSIYGTELFQVNSVTWLSSFSCLCDCKCHLTQTSL